MEQQLVMPEKCIRCGEVFDLLYDMPRSEERAWLRDSGKGSKKVDTDELLCWDCREEGKKRDEDFEL